MHCEDLLEGLDDVGSEPRAVDVPCCVGEQAHPNAEFRGNKSKCSPSGGVWSES